LALLPPILYREITTEEEMSSEDRRAPGTSRTPFEGLVEVGGALGPSFEAQAVNVSEDGMMLRTAYLPEAGQPLTCRFDSGSGGTVLASGEVVWTQAAEKGGEFAIRFTDMDPESVDALKRICGLSAAAGGPAPVISGSKVRLHIEGLASPMRAKIKDSGSSEIRVGSDLGFLQVGKPLELEDSANGSKRPASIDRVEVEVDPTSHVPQLVVTLRYADAPATTSANPAATAAPRPGKVDDLEAVEEAGAQMKGAVARNIARIGPAMERFAKRAATTVAMLAARTTTKTDDSAAPRRTTAPAPGGGLHASGKRVVRGEAVSTTDEAPATPKVKLTKRNAAIASAVMLAAILGALALKKTHHDAPVATVPAPDASGATAAATPASDVPPLSAAPETTPVAAQPLAANPFPPAAPAPAAPPVSNEPMASNDDSADEPTHAEHHKHVHVAPFGNGPVHHGNILRLKMDGPIDSIEGAQQPTGFTVKVPGHKSLEAAGPLASRDSRIAAIKVENAGAGAELTVAFKDGVPNYQVRASGDTLVIALAPAGDLDKTVARKDGKGESSSKHHKGSHKKN
jgi:hypothetical protein